MSNQTHVAIVTGAASGIGSATAIKLSQAGYKVLLADIDLVGAEKVAAQCESGAEAIRCDVTQEADIVATVKHATTLGELKILVNNAGAGGSQRTIFDLDAAEWDFTMNLLLRSLALFTREAGNVMGKDSAIVNVASVASFGAGYSPLAYGVAKAGVIQLTRITAAQLSQKGIRVNAVCPGMILTGIYTASLEAGSNEANQVNAYMEAVAPKAQPLQTAGRPDHIADAICYLASPQASFVTGTHLLVDGGMLVGPRHSWDPEMQQERQQRFATTTATQQS